jgi:hypothetical protein
VQQFDFKLLFAKNPMFYLIVFALLILFALLEQKVNQVFFAFVGNPPATPVAGDDDDDDDSYPHGSKDD